MNSSSIGRRHRRKSSSAKVGDRPPQQQQQQQQQQHYYNDAPPGNSKSSRGGFWSYFNRIRQQVANGGREEGKGHAYEKRNSDNTINNNSISSGIGDTLLPKTYKQKSSSKSTKTKTAMSQSPPSPLSSSSPNNNNRSSMNNKSSSKKTKNTISPTTRACMNINNSFLLGTIDNKRRYRHKKRSILYRIFWSSLPRRLLVGFTVLYLSIFHLLVPFASYCLFGITHHGDHGITGDEILARLNHDPRFDSLLPSLKEEKRILHTIEIKRSRLEYNKRHPETTKRATILEEIVPKWYHRNDIIIATTTTGIAAEDIINENSQKKENRKKNKKTANANANAAAAAHDEKKKQNEEKEEETKQKKEQRQLPEKKKKKNNNNNKDNDVVVVASSAGGDTTAEADTGGDAVVEDTEAEAADTVDDIVVSDRIQKLNKKMKNIEMEEATAEGEGDDEEKKNDDVNVDDGGDDDGDGGSDGNDGGDDDGGDDDGGDDDDDNTAVSVRDSNAGNHNNKQHQPQMKKKRYHTVAGGNSHNNNRILEVSGGIAEEIIEDDNANGSGSLLLPIRTIHNQQKLAAIYSSCGTTTNTTTDDTTTAANNNSTTVTRTRTTATATTLVVQTSIDRMWILKETCKRWNIDPIIAVVFVPHSESFIGDTEGTNERKTLLNILERTEQELLGGGSGSGSGGKNGDNNEINSPAAVGCSNLYIIRYIADPIESIEGRYPVNRMRNVGLDYVTTNQVLMIDIDFIPSQDLDTTIKNATQKQQQQQQRKTNNATTNIALVVPAFERRKPIDCLDEVSCSKHLKDSDRNNFLPHTFEELQKCYSTKSSINNTESDCIVFQSEYNWDGHSTTRSKQWINEQFYDNINNNSNDNDSDKSFRKIPCFDTARYEPYVVLQWCPSTRISTTTKGGGVVDVNGNDNNNNNNNTGIGIAPLSPYYDERFYGYGKNKIELISHLRFMSYEFHILPKGYIIHNPHVESKTKYRWNDIQHSSLHKTMDTLYNTIFMKELYKMYTSHTHTTTTGNSIVELCEQKK